MKDKYNKTAERLWEKIEYYRNDLKLEEVDLKKPFPVDQLAKTSPLINKLIEETEKEFKYEMGEYQCSWAVWKAITNQSMKGYNETNQTNLVPRN